MNSTDDPKCTESNRMKRIKCLQKYVGTHTLLPEPIPLTYSTNPCS